MHGIKDMLSGKGERENQERHKAFRDAIPDDFLAGTTIQERAAKHPAYSGPMSNSMDAANYRRAHYGGKGPQSKAEHADFAEYQRTHTPDGLLIQDERPSPRRSVIEWLVELIMP